MTALVTVIIPVAPYHLPLVARAIASAQAQTVPCDILPILDEHGHGAGWVRNRGIEQVQSEFIVLLDADDELLPTYVERCLAVYRQTGRYVYSDFRDDTGKVYPAPECAWTNHTWHTVTTLLPAAWAKAVDGFDETLDANEDTDFYVKLNTRRMCGIRLPEALMVYHTSDGKRHTALDDAERERFFALMDTRYRGKLMGCCGTPPVSQALSESYGTVQARPKWGYGKRTAIGTVSGRNYGRIDGGYVIAIDPRDAAARPDLWDVLPAEKPDDDAAAEEPPDDIDALFAGLMRITTSRAPMPKPAVPPPPAAPVAVKPDVARIVRLGANVPAVHLQRDPVFVFPDKDYPSYTDARRLVELSGFEAVKWAGIEWDNPNGLYIFLSPEPPENLARVRFRGRAIWWSLEYGGEYEPDLSNWRGEVWASDPAWAAAHDAKFVLMGSHPDLVPKEFYGGECWEYDYVMLAYMTHRRQVIQQQLADLRTPANPYPGYGIERHQHLVCSKLMLHVHQGEWAAIAPQRIALAAAYRLPVAHETVPDAGAYEDWLHLSRYETLADRVREMLSNPFLSHAGDALHRYFCVENTFRKCVEGALK